MPFNAWYHPRRQCQEFVFVGCVHMANDHILNRLARVADDPPDYLIFTGDVTGSQQLEEFKCLFYNHVYNRARRELGIGTSTDQSLSDSELLDYVGDNPPSPGSTLKKGYRALMGYQYLLEGQSPIEANTAASALPDQEIAEGIRRIARDFEYYGPWVKTLPEAVRRGVVATLKLDAEKLVAAVEPMREAGTKVIMVGGNWDNAQNTAENTIGEGIDVSDTIPFFREHGIDFHYCIGHQITKYAMLIFPPYWELARCSNDTFVRLQNVLRNYDVRLGSTVIAVAHGAPSWQVHNPTAVDAPTGDRKTVLDTLDKVLAQINPDEVVYGHEHNPLKDIEGRQLPLNTKYLMRADGETVRLVDNPAIFGDSLNQIIGSYLPFQHFKALSIRAGTNPRPRLFGGGRDPVYVY